MYPLQSFFSISDWLRITRRKKRAYPYSLASIQLFFTLLQAPYPTTWQKGTTLLMCLYVSCGDTIIITPVTALSMTNHVFDLLPVGSFAELFSVKTLFFIWSKGGWNIDAICHCLWLQCGKSFRFWNIEQSFRTVIHAWYIVLVADG